MFEELKKFVYAGIGATAITREKVQAAFDEMVEKGKISSEEANQMVEEVVEKGKKDWEDTKKDIDQNIEEFMQRANIVTRKEHNALVERVAQLEGRIEELLHKQQDGGDVAGEEGE